MFFIVGSALLPVALLALYIYRVDKVQPEPAIWLWKAVLFGVASALLDSFILSFFPQPQGPVATAFLGAAIPEEACKMFMLYLLIRKNPYFDDKLDGIVYGSYVGLGFAAIENILYLFNNLGNFIQVAIGRAVFAVPGHFLFGILMGYFISLAYYTRFNDKLRKLFLVLAYVVPMLCHGIYDSILMVSEATPEISGILTIVFLLFFNWLRKKGLSKIDRMKA